MRRINYGSSNNDYIDIKTVSDELRFVECMKLYKSHETLEQLENALKLKAKTKIKLVF
tara:strand:+ start:1216 stop:1389 length:174 start_codon:yes stop_codon:yes gene_type:complete